MLIALLLLISAVEIALHTRGPIWSLCLSLGTLSFLHTSKIRFHLADSAPATPSKSAHNASPSQEAFLCRGFAFVDFLSHQEALNAMEGVAGTHLYGRRLVCEWAATSEEGLDDLRAKTASKFQPTVDTYTEATETRKRKKHEE